MAVSPLTGSRLRARRLAIGLGQSQLASTLGISASYLNLIEHNRRRIAEDLLVRVADALGMPVSSLREGAEGALLEGLRAAAAEVPASAAEADRAEDFVGRFPGWAAAVMALHRKARALDRAVKALNDRLTHDPHLSASLHEVLSAVSSVRTTSSILTDIDDLDAEWRARFLSNLSQDSERLSRGAEALAAYLDASEEEASTGFATPQEEVEAWAAALDWDLAAANPFETSQHLTTAAARQIAQDLHARARADLEAMPEPGFSQALRDCGPEPLSLARRFGGDVMTAIRRIALAPGSGLGLVTCDASGMLILRKPVSGFHVPRFSAACPLWPLYTALARPGTPVEAVVALAGERGARFRVRAWCQSSHPEGFRGTELREAAMLILPEPAGPEPALLVGSTCRVCVRAVCPARREPAIVSQ